MLLGAHQLFQLSMFESQEKDLFKFFYATLKDRFMNMFKDLQNKKTAPSQGKAD